MLHKYKPTEIWNCDEFIAQVGQNGGALVLANIDFRSMHFITPYERKWFLVMSCIFNVASECISNF